MSGEGRCSWDEFSGRGLASIPCSLLGARFPANGVIDGRESMLMGCIPLLFHPLHIHLLPPFSFLPHLHSFHRGWCWLLGVVLVLLLGLLAWLPVFDSPHLQTGIWVCTWLLCKALLLAHVQGGMWWMVVEKCGGFDVVVVRKR